MARKSHNSRHAHNVCYLLPLPKTRDNLHHPIYYIQKPSHLEWSIWSCFLLRRLWSDHARWCCLYDSHSPMHRVRQGSLAWQDLGWLCGKRGPIGCHHNWWKFRVNCSHISVYISWGILHEWCSPTHCSFERSGTLTVGRVNDFEATSEPYVVFWTDKDLLLNWIPVIAFEVMTS